MQEHEGQEGRACAPYRVDPTGFNHQVSLTCGLTIDHLRATMGEFVEFLGFINQQLHTRGTSRLESMLMPANFSSIVGEFMSANIPKHCPTLVKNQYHNGHPDLIPTGQFPQNAVQHSSEGIEVKGSRYLRGWQGHNPEDCWLIVFIFDSNRPRDTTTGVPPRPFRFVQVLGARLNREDWLFAGRSGASRRTITASVTTSGYEKMIQNWIYRDPRRGGVVGAEAELEEA